ncbi:MAG: hypothetical protein H0T70_04405 [Acidimicrobiia bacterium]|nr:hypothetical protein [Acidimicrobiia bacterium]
MNRRIAGLCAAVLVLGAGCGGNDEGEGDTYSRADQNEDIRRVQMRIIDQQVRDGELPPITPKMFNLEGRFDFEFIDGPKADRDVIRSSEDGTRGPKLRWDLNRNGRIDPDEREITERELYDATLRAHDEAERRVISRSDAPET